MLLFFEWVLSLCMQWLRISQPVQWPCASRAKLRWALLVYPPDISLEVGKLPAAGTPVQ